MFLARVPRSFGRPKTRADFWRSKIERTKERDADVQKALLMHGWQVIRIWEHEVKPDLQSVVDRVRSILIPYRNLEPNQRRIAREG
jgi:DNA mismatch endonuclease (patch repair protein)